MPERVTIAEYDPAWADRFAEIAASVSNALGPLALAIEHVGSTSVPGLAAKPIIDIDIAVGDQHAVQEAIRLLAVLGYEHRGDLGVPGREAFSIPPGAIPHHLYVCTSDNPEFKRHLAFRDRLRSHRGIAERYGDLKRRLAAQFGNDREGYTAAKTGFIEQVLSEIRECAECADRERDAAFGESDFEQR